jgi:hypothetical protein
MTIFQQPMLWTLSGLFCFVLGTATLAEGHMIGDAFIGIYVVACVQGLRLTK